MEHADIEKLKQIPLFSEIRKNQKSMEKLADICKTRYYKKGDIIIKEGETGDEMFIVMSGGVEILKRTRAGDDYTVVRLLAEHNVFIGELALIDDDTRSATVRASMDSDFLVIRKKDFVSLGNDYPKIGLTITRAIAKLLAGRLRKTNQDMLTLFDALVTEIQGDKTDI